MGRGPVETQRQERNESMKIQDKEMGWWEPHTNGQTLIVLCTTVPIGKGWELENGMCSSWPLNWQDNKIKIIDLTAILMSYIK